MSRWCDQFALPPAYVEQCLKAASEGDAEVLSFIEHLQLEQQEDWQGGAKLLHFDTDKMWEPIHRSLSEDFDSFGEIDPESGEYPVNLVFFGGRSILTHGYRTAYFVSADEVPGVAGALKAFDEGTIRDNFFEMPDDQFHEINDEVYQHTLEVFRELRQFWEKAADSGCAILSTISH